MTPLMATGIVSPSRAPLGTRSVIDYEANECSFKYYCLAAFLSF